MYSTSAHVAPHPRTNPLRDVTSAMRGVRRPHNPRIQHDGIQEECSDEENEHSLMKYMHHDSEEKPEKPERRSGQGRPPKQKALPEHWLQHASLQRVNSMLATMENVSKQMVVELEAAERSPVVGPAMLTICKAVKRRFDDAVDRLSFHKSINKEKHTQYFERFEDPCDGCTQTVWHLEEDPELEVSREPGRRRGRRRGRLTYQAAVLSGGLTPLCAIVLHAKHGHTFSNWLHSVARVA